VLGEVLPDVLQSMAMLAGLYCDVRGTRKSLEMGEDAWKLGMEVLGPEHERLHRIQFTLARSYYAHGDFWKSRQNACGSPSCWYVMGPEFIGAVAMDGGLGLNRDP
jgi:hypothetical protein